MRRIWMFVVFFSYFPADPFAETKKTVYPTYPIHVVHPGYLFRPNYPDHFDDLNIHNYLTNIDHSKTDADINSSQDLEDKGNKIKIP